MDTPRRYHTIDAIRAAAVISMVLYHLYYDIFCLFGGHPEYCFLTPIYLWERSICITFIVISGVSLNFSRHGYRRGLIVAGCAMAVTLVTYVMFPEEAIWFGVLHLLSVSMLLTTAIRPLLDKLKPIVGMIVFFVLFMLCYGIPNGHIGLFSYPLIRLPAALYQYKWLSVVGFLSGDYYSMDYFPILPWVFLFLFGYFLWRFIKEKGLDRYFCKKIPVLDFIGRHSLLIYMLHQPILYGICYLIMGQK